MPPRHIYLHIPFCARRCSYCDFSIAVRRHIPVDEYLDALRGELESRLAGTSIWEVDTLYLGGGTPSLLGGHGVARVLALLLDYVSLVDDAEITLEANPDDIAPEVVRAWVARGVNRLSIGSQSFDDRVLTWMRRTHDASAIGRAVEAARSGGIDEISLDLIFALPESLGRDWASDLDRAISLSPPHISVYGLTIEPMTPIGRWRDRGDLRESPEERYEEEFLLAHERLTAVGYEHYEVSSYARPGHRARHNSSYWRRVPYLGLGPAAHSFDGEARRWNISGYAQWADRATAGLDPLDNGELLGPDARAAEEAYLGLRTTDGLEISPPVAERVQPWIDAGWARLDRRHLRLTPAGWLRLDSLCEALTVIPSR
ncbi:MAG: radical SAM family heme chaperone HemW [Gemmatimonadota bacterium]|nr:radical SAM family heme chaperone HemW [Gemmatimonadota bacterium]